MNGGTVTKAIVTVADMARMCGLSRARFHQLVKEGVFPTPIYNIMTRRPFFTEPMQQICLEVRRRNCGVNGRPVLFYAARIGSTVVKAKTRKRTPVPMNDQFTELVESLGCLGLTTVNASQVEIALREIYPKGLVGIDQGTVLRAVFLHLRRRDSSENVGRKE